MFSHLFRTTVILAALCGVATGAETYRLASGLQLQAPSNWAVTVVSPEGGLAKLNPHGNDAEWETYFAGILTEPGTGGVGDPSAMLDSITKTFQVWRLKTNGPPVPLGTAGGAAGRLHSFRAWRGIVPVAIDIHLVDIGDGKIAGLMAVGRRDLIERRAVDTLGIASSFRAAAAAPAGPMVMPTASPSIHPSTPPPVTSSARMSQPTSRIAKQWTERLSDHKLVAFSSYSSGGSGGGMNSQKTLRLFANGSFSYNSSSSVSIYVPGANASSADRGADQGHWQIVEHAGQPILELVSRNGGVDRFTLSSEDTKTFLNGRRWFVVGINE